LVPGKGSEQVLAAAAQLVRTRPEITTVIAGSAQHPFLAELQRRHEDLPAAIRAQIMLRPEVSEQEKRDLFAAADIFVFPSRCDSFGIVIAEAWAAGLPVIATPVGGIPDFLNDRETGIFCSVNNPKDLASKIELVLHDEPLRQRLIGNGRRLVREGYDWDKVAREMKTVFRFSPPKHRGGDSV